MLDARGARSVLLVTGGDSFARSGAEVVEAPRAATVMLRLGGPIGAFCLTEAVVTTARALAGGHAGWGCVLGWDEEGALARPPRRPRVRLSPPMDELKSPQLEVAGT